MTSIDSTEKINNLISAMATADLLVMALYFGGLSAMQSSKRLRLLFPGPQDKSSDEMSKRKQKEMCATAIPKSTKGGTRKSLLHSVIVLLLLTSIIVETSIFAEKCMARFIPGMCCASVAAMGSLTNAIIKTRLKPKFSNNLRLVGPVISEWCFLALFGAIGVSANLGTAFSRGVSSFSFAIIALAAHIFTIGFGSFAFTNAIPKIALTEKLFPLGLEEVLVSSNAGIGGASTAAAFAGSLREDRVSTDRKRGLIYAGTLWGVVGYGKRFLFKIRHYILR